MVFLGRRPFRRPRWLEAVIVSALSAGLAGRATAADTRPAILRQSIEKMLNGRYVGTPEVSRVVFDMFDEWNAKLGFKAFGR